jgi:hypothetical protein
MADRSGYIGRAPGDSSVTVARQTFSPTGITTDFTFESGYTPGYFDIFINGAKMIEGSDYTSTDGSTFVILNGGAISGDVIEGVAYKAFNAATATIGISSAGTPISTQANTLNFVGTGNTFALRGTTIDVSISGGAGAGGTWSNYDGVLGVTTTKKVKIQNNLEVTGVTTSTGGFVGNVTGTVSGNAGSATVLASSRNIGGVAFNGSGDINLPGVNQSGTQNTSGTAAGLSGTPDITVRNIVGVAATFTGVLTYEDVTNIDSIGIVTARTGIKVLAGGINAVGVVTGTTGVQVGSGQSFGANGPTAVYYGDGSNLTNLPAAGLTTEALVSSGIVTTLNLTAAQDHKVTASGITTITVSGGTEADSHTVRIINSGITTVGFSTFFLFPSGSAPSLPTADGAISLISFTVNRVGAGGTQLLAGASVNYS